MRTCAQHLWYMLIAKNFNLFRNYLIVKVLINPIYDVQFLLFFGKISHL